MEKLSNNLEGPTRPTVSNPNLIKIRWLARVSGHSEALSSDNGTQDHPKKLRGAAVPLVGTSN